MEETKENFEAITIEESVKEEIREEYEELRQSIEKFSVKIGKLFSYSQTFLRGIVQGVGIALGSGVVFVILSALLYQTVSYLGFGSELKELLPVKTLPGDSILK